MPECLFATPVLVNAKDLADRFQSYHWERRSSTSEPHEAACRFGGYTASQSRPKPGVLRLATLGTVKRCGRRLRLPNPKSFDKGKLR
jgi:hypothetical protein